MAALTDLALQLRELRDAERRMAPATGLLLIGTIAIASAYWSKVGARVMLIGTRR